MPHLHAVAVREGNETAETAASISWVNPADITIVSANNHMVNTLSSN
jgi:hypothetical protein